MMTRRVKLVMYPKLQKLRHSGYAMLYVLVGMLRPLRKNSVILVTNRSNALTGNLKFIYDKLDKKRYSVRKFVIPGPSAHVWSRATQTARMIVAMAQTQYTLVDDFLSAVYTIRLRPGARLIQVWHASGALKRIGYSRAGTSGAPVETSVSHKNYTDVIVSAEAVRGSYAEAFGVPLSIVHATGAPRSDLFFDRGEQSRVIGRLYQRLPVLEGRRVILFAPTFRGRGRGDAHYPETFIDLTSLGAALGDNDLLIVKMHPFVKSRFRIPPALKGKIIDLSDYPEINDLLLICDLLITDYSSVIFDFALLARPVVFYVPDIGEYQVERDFFFDFDEYAYGPVVCDFDSLLKTLDLADVDVDRLTSFDEKFISACDGHATERFCATILDENRVPPVMAGTSDAQCWGSI